MNKFALTALAFAVAGLCHASVNYTVQTSLNGDSLQTGTNTVDINGVTSPDVLSLEVTAFSNNVGSGSGVEYVSIAFQTSGPDTNESYDLDGITLEIRIIDNNNPTSFVNYNTTFGGDYTTDGGGNPTFSDVLTWTPAGPQPLPAPSTYQFSIDASDNVGAGNPAGSVNGTATDLGSAPEPGTIALMGGGLALLGLVRRRKA